MRGSVAELFIRVLLQCMRRFRQQCWCQVILLRCPVTAVPCTVMLFLSLETVLWMKACLQVTIGHVFMFLVVDKAIYC